MAGGENQRRVMLEVPGKEPVCLCSIKVNAPKPKYYILMTVEELKDMPRGLWGFNEYKDYRDLLTELIGKLVALVGEENVVWISPINRDKRTHDDRVPKGRRDRQPTRADFIEALKDSDVKLSGGTIFNYGHGHGEYPELIFDGKSFSAYTINPNSEDKDKYFDMLVKRGIKLNGKVLTKNDKKKYLEGNNNDIFGKDLVKIDYLNQYTKSKHCVCHQNRFSGTWKGTLPEGLSGEELLGEKWGKKLPKAVFHFPNPVINPITQKIDINSTPDVQIISRFLNDLAIEIDSLCIEKKENRYITRANGKIEPYVPDRNSKGQVIRKTVVNAGTREEKLIEDVIEDLN